MKIELEGPGRSSNYTSGNRALERIMALQVLTESGKVISESREVLLTRMYLAFSCNLTPPVMSFIVFDCISD